MRFGRALLLLQRCCDDRLHGAAQVSRDAWSTGVRLPSEPNCALLRHSARGRKPMNADSSTCHLLLLCRQRVNEIEVRIILQSLFTSSYVHVSWARDQILMVVL